MDNYNNLLESVCNLLTENKQKVIREINRTVLLTYWNIGRYIVEFEQHGSGRAKYGAELLKNLAKDLTSNFGRGYSYRNLQLAKKLYITFPIVQSLIAQSENGVKLSAVNSALIQVSWTHLVRLLSLRDEVERNFYLVETVENNWTVRNLNRQIDSSLYERTLISQMSHQNINESFNHQDVLKDPYVLEFLGMTESNSYSENDLESAIISNIETFLLELGKGFSFVARQFRISSESEHFYIDLVFYNRLLRSHVLIDLKIGKLRHQDIGQMQMYVNFFDREIKTEFENNTLGIILCKEKNDFVIEYSLPQNNTQIYPKEYKLYLPNKAELKVLLSKYL